MSFSKYPEYKDSGIPWLGETPSHWTVKRYKQVFSERGERSLDGSEELMSVSAYYGVKPRAGTLDEGEHLSRAESLEGYKICRARDLVINIMLAWNRGLGFAWQDGIVSPAYCVFLIVDDSRPEFLDYLVRSDEMIRYFKAFSTGVIDSRLRIYPETFGSLYVVLPRSDEQAQIARFLDHETARIDALIEQQQRLIELLKEKRQAVISHAVTKGLDSTVPLKDSGVEWLGEVPGHWAVVRIKHIKSKCQNAFVDGPFGSNLKSEHFVADGGVYVIESGFATTGELAPSELKQITPSHFETIRRSEVRQGDIVLAKIGARYGMCSILPELDKPAVVSGNSLKLTVNDQICDSRFAVFVFQHLKERGAIEDIVNFTAQPALSLGEMNNLPFPLPGLPEQLNIVNELNSRLDDFDALSIESKRMMSLSVERRSALISAAVTGKIDVRNWLPPASHMEQESQQELAHG